jgi:hypothetical protein
LCIKEEGALGMATYNASDVSMSMRMHTKACASHKSTFTHWMEVDSSYDIPNADNIEEGSGYGDYWYTYYSGNEILGKSVYSQGGMSYYKYIKDGVGEEYECDCERPYTKLEGFSQDELITIKREDVCI